MQQQQQQQQQSTGPSPIHPVYSRTASPGSPRRWAAASTWRHRRTSSAVSPSAPPPSSSPSSSHPRAHRASSASHVRGRGKGALAHEEHIRNDAVRPHVLFFPRVKLSAEDLGACIVQSSNRYHTSVATLAPESTRANDSRATKTIPRIPPHNPRAPEIDQSAPVPFALRTTFSSLISRWTMPHMCRNAMASAIWPK